MGREHSGKTESQWAEANDRKETQVYFAELAARADPKTRHSRMPPVGSVVRQGCTTARKLAGAGLSLCRDGARDDAVRALLGNGALMKERGRLAQARHWFLKGARRAGRPGRKRRAAEAHHDLLTLAAERGNLAEVIEHAAAAIELYPLNRPRMPYLAHDFAFVFIRNRLYSIALPLFEVLPQDGPAPRPLARTKHLGGRLRTRPPV
jgi:hypothetical protein